MSLPRQGTAARAGIIRTVYDPACGTGGMLAIAEDRKRGGRKLVITPDGETQRPRPRVSTARS